jgi:hypothetical protein
MTSTIYLIIEENLKYEYSSTRTMNNWWEWFADNDLSEYSDVSWLSCSHLVVPPNPMPHTSWRILLCLYCCADTGLHAPVDNSTVPCRLFRQDWLIDWFDWWIDSLIHSFIHSFVRRLFPVKWFPLLSLTRGLCNGPPLIFYMKTRWICTGQPFIFYLKTRWLVV